jgi:hypothetical protein
MVARIVPQKIVVDTLPIRCPTIVPMVDIGTALLRRPSGPDGVFWIVGALVPSGCAPMTEPSTPAEITQRSSGSSRQLRALGILGAGLARGDTPAQALAVLQGRAEAALAIKHALGPAAKAWVGFSGNRHARRRLALNFGGHR